MANLEQCSACQGFLPKGKTTCPNCRAARPSRLLWIGGALGGGAIAFTLMACYGMPPCKDGTRDCYKPDANGQTTPPTTVGDAGTGTPPTTAKDGG